MTAALERLERLQASMADIALVADPSVFRKDPIAFAAARGLEPGDARALQRWQSRLLTYRSLIRFALQAPLPDCFPITKTLLGSEWEGCVDAFLESRTIQSPYYRHIHPHFVEWLSTSSWGQDRWPFLLSLAHFEYLELEVLRAPEDEAGPSLLSTPGAHRRVRFSTSARNLAYPWRVHETTEEEPTPSDGLALLFCHRLPDGRYQQRELGGPSSALITRLLENQTIGAAAEAVELKRAEAFAILEELRLEGAVLGYA